jgi:hypothetical protein
VVLDGGTEFRVTEAGGGLGVGEDLLENEAFGRALVGALQGLYRAYQKLAMYPAGHPSVPAAIEDAAGRFSDALESRDSLVLGVTQNELLFEEVVVSANSVPLRGLADLLHELDMAAIEFRRGLSRPDLEAVVHLLARARRESIRGAELAVLQENESTGSVRLCAIDYRALSFGEGAQTATADDDANPWQQLSRVLTDPSSYGNTDSVNHLADEVSERIEALEGAGVNGLRHELHRQVRDMAEMSGEQRDALRARLGAFVAALNPELRKCLLQLGRNRSNESLSLMNQLTESVPPEELLEALENVDRVGGRAHGELVQLLRKLVRISEYRPALQTQLEDTLGRWGVAPGALQNSGSLGKAVEEVLQRRTDHEYNPDEYQMLLGDLTSGELQGEAPASAALYGDASDVVSMQCHCAEIAVQLLGRHDGDEHRAALFGYVGTHSAGMLQRGMFAPVLHAVVAARADRVLKAEHEQIRLAAEGFLEDLCDRSKVQLVLDQLNSRKPIPLEAMALLELGGAQSIEAILDRLTTDSDDPTFSGMLRRFCAEQPTEEWTRVLPRRIAEGWSLLEPVFHVVQLMHPKAAERILRQLQTHPSSRVRREALVILCGLDPDHCIARYIEPALGDESLRVVNTALRRLAALETRESVTSLGAYVAGEISGSWLSDEAMSLATSLLAALGNPGIEEISSRLDALRLDLSPAMGLRGHCLAEALEGKQHDSARARISLKRWRRSPARWISGLSLRTKKRRGIR